MFDTKNKLILYSYHSSWQMNFKSFRLSACFAISMTEKMGDWSSHRNQSKQFQKMHMGNSTRLGSKVWRDMTCVSQKVSLILMSLFYVTYTFRCSCYWPSLVVNKCVLMKIQLKMCRFDVTLTRYQCYVCISLFCIFLILMLWILWNTFVE